MIDPRLRVLRVVADRGTITAAAADLGYTPSALSAQMRTLARDVGTPLLEPDGRGLRLTDAAHTLLARSDELFARWEEIRGEVLATGEANLGHLRLAGFSTAAPALLVAVARRAATAFPGTEVRISEADPDVCLELLLAGQVDVAVLVNVDAPTAGTDPRLVQRPLLADRLDLLVPPDHVLAGRSSIDLGEAAEEPWIMDRPGRPYHRLMLSACAAAGFRPRQAHQAMEWDTAAALVGAGLGVSLIPRLARLPDGERLVRVPLHGDAPVRHVRTSVRRGTTHQPEIAFALAELRRTADRISAAGVSPDGPPGTPDARRP